LVVDEVLPTVVDKLGEGVAEFVGGLEESEDVVELSGLVFVGELGLDVLEVFGSYSTLSIFIGMTFFICLVDFQI